MSHPLPPKGLKENAKKSIKNRPPGSLPYKKNTKKAVANRDLRYAEWPDFEERRESTAGKRREDMDNLETLHDQLRDNWKKNGVTVHEAPDADSACKAVLGILQGAGIKKLLKSKTMLSEEIELNNFLAANDVQVVETDLGEYIVQLRDEIPSHITMPAMHLTREDVGKLFAEKLGVEYTDDPPTLTKIARKVLRDEFLSAEAGLCGVNFAVAETGHIATVTNEGNGRMVTSLPRVVIALMGWERVTRSLDELAMLYQLLARSATGQKSTVYLNMLHGPSPGPVGPEEVHLVIVDNGRKKIHADPEMREMLGCIHCGACLNACPVYQQIGGHPYGGIYPGPMGKVFTPLLQGLEAAPHHPFASTLCGACEEICPVSLPLPKFLLTLRSRIIDQAEKRGIEGAAWKGFTTMMQSSERFRLASGLAGLLQRSVPGSTKIPVPGWSGSRENPKLAKRSFRDLYNSEISDEKPDQSNPGKNKGETDNE